MSRIIVINDDTAFLHMMQTLLQEQGYEVMLQIEGSGAHGLVRDARPDLIILDIRMGSPDTGWMVLELLRLDPATRNIPVIVCSADVINLRAKEGMLRDQGYDVIEKPFDLDTLLTMVER